MVFVKYIIYLHLFIHIQLYNIILSCLLCEFYTSMFLLAGACVDVIVDNDNVLQGIFFQDHEMRQCFSSYPDLVCVDATYKLIELRFPLYIMLVEDGNGQSEIVAAFMVLQETDSTISKMVDLFKKYNSSWERVRVIMTDKDVTERSVFSAQIPSARLVICLFHTLGSFRREVTLEKMGITSDNEISV